jgi:hypothetical protein
MTSDASINVISVNITINNQTNISTLELLPSIKQFESRISDYYPRLPIHIHTQNISLIGNTSKLILLGNGFFGERDWGIASSKRSSTEISNYIFPYSIN